MPGGRRGLLRPALGSLLAAAGALAFCGCGSAGSGSSTRTSSSSTPAYLHAPVTREQLLVEQGARLIVADGCAACHLSASTPVPSPSFTSFAGHRVTLANGRSVLVNESFLREGLVDPGANEIRGYPAAPMLAALARLRLAAHPGELAALGAFIEQVGPETE